MAVGDAVLRILFVINVFPMYFQKIYNFWNFSKQLNNFKFKSQSEMRGKTKGFTLQNKMYMKIFILINI